MSERDLGQKSSDGRSSNGNLELLIGDVRGKIFSIDLQPKLNFKPNKIKSKIPA